MAEQSGAARFWGQLGDAFVPGDAYNPQSGWNRQATITGLARLGGGMAAGPLGGYIAGAIANTAQGQPWHAGMFSRTNEAQPGGISYQPITGVGFGRPQYTAGPMPAIGMPQVGGWPSRGKLADLVSNPQMTTGGNLPASRQQDLMNERMAQREAQGYAGGAMPSGGGAMSAGVRGAIHGPMAQMLAEGMRDNANSQFMAGEQAKYQSRMSKTRA